MPDPGDLGRAGRDAGRDPGDPGRDPAPDAGPFDPTGLDLARQVAAAAGRSVVAPPPRAAKPRKKAGRGRTASDRGEPVPLGDALEELISERGWGTEVNVHLLLGRWPELVGDAVAAHTRPEAFREGVVVVRTDSTNWAAQLRLMAPQLVAKMNEALGEGTIRQVRVLAPEAPSWRHGPRSVKGRGPRDTYG